MRIGVPREIKPHEHRVGLTPASVRELTARGHEVVVEHNAGAGIGATDDSYIIAGASILPDAAQVFDAAEMIVKVKEPQESERKRLKPGQILFTYLHLAADRDQARDLIDSGATCIAYETVTSPAGDLPLLASMSEVAGRMAIQVGVRALEKSAGGKGLLLGAVPGVQRGTVVVLGGGVVGTHAIDVALGMGARVIVIDRSPLALKRLWQQFGARLETAYATREAVEKYCALADLVIGAVLIPGAAAPRLVDRAILSRIETGSVLVDVAIDQGGCFETSHPTTHDAPTYVVDGVIHYCVTNMPGGVPRSSTVALNNVTLPYVIKLAEAGLEALRHDQHLRNGLNVYQGRLTHPAVAEALGLASIDATLALQSH